MFSTNELYQFTIENEDMDLWRSHIEKENYDLALEICESKKNAYIKKVARLYAHSLFEKKNYNESVFLYAKSDEPFEYIALNFVAKNLFDPLSCKSV
jgi:vacuolar protein sorting-associated protein 18